MQNLTQLFQLIALGRATVVIAESARVDLRQDLVAVPVVDTPVVTTVIAWPELSRSRVVADLVRVATSLQGRTVKLSGRYPGERISTRRATSVSVETIGAHHALQ